MKEQSIILNSQMIRPTLDSRKTMTRWPIKPQPEWLQAGRYNVFYPKWKGKDYGNLKHLAEYCPYGQPGDRLFITQSSLSTKKQSFQERFWERVYKFSNCWEWFGKVNHKNYGMIGYNGKNISSQRASWIIHFGEIPKDEHVLHHCDLSWCVNPDHLYLGTNDDNIADKIARNRVPKSRGVDNGHAILTAKQVEEIHKLYWEKRLHQLEIAKQFNISQSEISRIVNSKRWFAESEYPKKKIGHRTLEIVVVRVERLQEITEEDAKKEGVFQSWHAAMGFENGTYTESFVENWDTLYPKKPEYQWETNPWVWVIEFKNI